MAKWGKVEVYVERVFEKMTQELSTSKSMLFIFQSHAHISGFKMKSIKQAYDRLEKKKRKSLEPEARSHGNATLTLRQEAMTIGWLLMKSEIGKADRIQGIQTFAAIFQDTPLSKKAAKRLLKKYQSLF